MRKSSLFIVLATFFCTGILADNVAPQSYHQAGSANPSATQPTTSTMPNINDVDQMAQVNAIIQAAKKEQAAKIAQEQQQVATQPPQATVPTAPVDQAATNAANSKIIELQSQLSTLNQQNLLFQQEVDQRVQDLNSQNKSLFDQLQKLRQALFLLNQETNTLTTHVQTVQNQQQSALSPTNLKWIGLVIVVLLGLILIMMISQYMLRQRELKAQATAPKKLDESEYDFMGTSEAIPAKFDLVNAYVAMEDYTSARKVLEEIVQQGDEAQQKDAREALASLPTT